MVRKKPKQKTAPAVPAVYPSDGRDGDEDTEAHSLSQARSTTNDTTEGHGLARGARSTMNDTTEGHGLALGARSTMNDTTEGHGLALGARSTLNEDTTEGHDLARASLVTTPISGRDAGGAGSCRSLPPSASASRPVSASAAEDRNNTSKSKLNRQLVLGSPNV